VNIGTSLLLALAVESGIGIHSLPARPGSVDTSCPLPKSLHNLPSRLSPSEQPQPVPSIAPDSVPSWLKSDTNYTSDGLLKRILSVRFTVGTSPATKSKLLAAVGGIVVGGYHLTKDPEGIYTVYFGLASSPAVLVEILLWLKCQPAVKFVALVEGGTVSVAGSKKPSSQ